MNINNLKEKVINGYDIEFNEAMDLYNSDLESLTEAANDIRKYFMKDSFDLCTIINAKCGSCSEDCKFCAQSAHYGKNSDNYSLLDEDTILKDAKIQKDSGILRYSLVTSGKKLSDSDVDKVVKIVKRIKDEVDIEVCISHGLLSYENFKKLKEAGASRVHNNLETARSFFNDICTTHTYDEKIQALKNAKNAGMEVCSGGIFGLGESVEQRIEMAFTLKELGIKSVPINILTPIKNTPLENSQVLTDEEVNRIIAVYRFILKNSFIRLAGGRALLSDFGESAFLSGANAAISGHMLTTNGINTKNDLKLLKKIGYTPRLVNI
ncbi:MAG: biotin synthase BioB [Peptoniphilaceae bacterium]